MTKDLKKAAAEAPAHTMTRIEVIDLHRQLSELKNVKGFKLNYAINRTIASLAPLVNRFGLDKHVPETDEFRAYNDALMNGYKELAKGRTVITAKSEIIDFDINSEEAKALRVQLNKKYAAMLTEREAQVKEYNAFVKQPCGTGCEHPDDETYNIYHIAAEDIPDETDKAVWDACMNMIVE